MVELGPPLSPTLDNMQAPTPPFIHSDRPISRPLSEISDNSDIRRRSTVRVDKAGSIKTSRPNSEVRDLADSNKRLSASIPLGTITVNLVDYGSMGGKGNPAGPSSIASSSTSAPPPPSPTTKPGIKEKPASLAGKSTSILEGKEDGVNASNGEVESSSDGISPLLMAKRASLRPSPLGATYADVAKPILSPPLSSASAASFDSLRSSTDLSDKPSTKVKPSWLRRASGTAALRSKSKSPAPREELGIPASTSLPPILPPRKGGVTITTAGSLSEQAQAAASASQARMLPPELPSRFSYAAAAAAAGPSRSRLGEGQGRPAFSPANSQTSQKGEPVGNIRNRLAAWTAAAQSSSSFTLNRSESSQSLSLAASPGSTSSFASGSTTQRAQRVLGNAGTAVQKGWAGLRARGVGGSISGMSGLTGSGRRSSLEPSGSWAGGIGRRGSRDRTQSSDSEMRSVSVTDGPLFAQGVILRRGGDRPGKVFGRDLVDVARAWCVHDLAEMEGLSDWERRRRQSLPAVVVRTVDYLEVWGPKEEGIFRISGRSSHINRLRREFDAGADIDLLRCDPGDLDPHSVAGIFKSYLRELPIPLLTHTLAPRFEACVRIRQSGLPITQEGDEEDLSSLLTQLPSAHWFLLADIVKLLDLIPKHTATNRMTLNAVMLSLGPSLNIPGGVLTELLERREEFFATPPPITGTESANSIIDFGDINISPPALAKNELPPIPDEDTPPNTDPSPPKKKSPRLPHKPSITRLFSTSASPPTPKKQSSETVRSHNSIVDPSPPRVDLPIGLTSPLPTFESKNKALPAEPAVLDTVEDLNETIVTDDNTSDKSRLIPPLTPTPIADRYSNTTSHYPVLRSQKSSLSSVGTSASIPSSINPNLSVGDTSRLSEPPSSAANPAAVIRRGGQPVFFSHSGVGERRERTVSNVGSIAAASVKRNEEGAEVGVNGRGGDEGVEGTRNGQRLSAGPSSVSVRDVVRSMELST